MQYHKRYPICDVKNNRLIPCLYFLNTNDKKYPISDILSIELFTCRQMRVPFSMINGHEPYFPNVI